MTEKKEKIKCPGCKRKLSLSNFRRKSVLDPGIVEEGYTYCNDCLRYKK
jgi:hypothetical protein